MTKRAQFLAGYAAILLLAGCGSNPDSSTANTAPGGKAAEHIACAHGSGTLAKDCLVERTATPQGLVLTLRHPDGGFRRLLVTKDGRGVVAADGAQPAKVAIEGEGIAVAIGGDHYLLPATIKGGAPAR